MHLRKVYTSTVLAMKRLIVDVKDDTRTQSWPEKLWLNADPEFNTTVINNGLFSSAFEAGRQEEQGRVLALEAELVAARAAATKAYMDGAAAAKAEVDAIAKVLRDEAQAAYLQGIQAGKVMAAEVRKTEHKGAVGELWVLTKCKEFFPAAEIRSTAAEAHSADALLIMDGLEILIEVKNTAVFARAQFEKFKLDLETRQPRAHAGIYVSLNDTAPARSGDIQVDLAGGVPVLTLHGVSTDPGKLRLGVVTAQQIVFKIQALKRDSTAADAAKELRDIREQAHDIFHGPVARHIKQLRASMTASRSGVDALESVLYEKIAGLLSVKAPKATSSAGAGVGVGARAVTKPKHPRIQAGPSKQKMRRLDPVELLLGDTPNVHKH